MQWRDNGGHVPDDVWQLYWDGELTTAEVTRVDGHRIVCPACREAGELWQQLLTMATDLPDEPLPADAALSMQLHVLGRIRRQRRWHGLAALVAAVAFAPLLLEAVAWAASVWGWLADRLTGIGAGVELTSLLIRGAVRLLLWFGGLPPAVGTGLLLTVALANLLLLRIGLRVFERSLMGGTQA